MKNILKIILSLIFILLFIGFLYPFTIQLEAKEYPDAVIKYTDCSKYKKMLIEHKAKSVATVPVIPLTKKGKGWTDVMINTKKGWFYNDDRWGDKKEQGYESYFIKLQRTFDMNLLTVVGILYKYNHKGKTLYKAYFYMEKPMGSKSHFTGGVANIYVDVKNNIIVMHVIEKEYHYHIIGYVNKWKSKGGKLF